MSKKHRRHESVPYIPTQKLLLPGMNDNDSALISSVSPRTRHVVESNFRRSFMGGTDNESFREILDQVDDDKDEEIQNLQKFKSELKKFLIRESDDTTTISFEQFVSALKGIGILKQDAKIIFSKVSDGSSDNVDINKLLNKGNWIKYLYKAEIEQDKKNHYKRDPEDEKVEDYGNKKDKNEIKKLKIVLEEIEDVLRAKEELLEKEKKDKKSLILKYQSNEQKWKYAMSGVREQKDSQEVKLQQLESENKYLVQQNNELQDKNNDLTGKIGTLKNKFMDSEELKQEINDSNSRIVSLEHTKSGDQDRIHQLEVENKELKERAYDLSNRHNDAIAHIEELKINIMNNRTEQNNDDDILNESTKRSRRYTITPNPDQTLDEIVLVDMHNRNNNTRRRSTLRVNYIDSFAIQNMDKSVLDGLAEETPKYELETDGYIPYRHPSDGSSGSDDNASAPFQYSSIYLSRQHSNESVNSVKSLSTLSNSIPIKMPTISMPISPLTSIDIDHEEIEKTKITNKINEAIKLKKIKQKLTEEIKKELKLKHDDELNKAIIETKLKNNKKVKKLHSIHKDEIKKYRQEIVELKKIIKLIHFGNNENKQKEIIKKEVEIPLMDGNDYKEIEHVKDEHMNNEQLEIEEEIEVELQQKPCFSCFGLLGGKK